MNIDRIRKERELILLGAISVLLIGLLVVSAAKFKMEEQKSSNLDNKTEDIENKENPEESNREESSLEQSSSEKGQENVPSSTPTSIPSSHPVPSEKTEPSVSSTPSSMPVLPLTKEENDVVEYFSNLETTTFSLQNEEDLSFREKAKNAFTTVVDFLFYGSQIHGYTFSELTTSAKLKILKIALSIDHKIDTYFPNYKETIKTKMLNLKEKAALLYLEQTTKLCDAVGESACKEARQDFKNMKESFGFTWELIKGAASSSYESLKTILEEWYQSIR